MHIQRLASFSEDNFGGNPAGILIADELPTSQEMQRLAAEIGFSETAFAMAQDDAWRVRYFSPESEVPFCGHATIALGAALAMKCGNAVYRLTLNNAEITVEGRIDDGRLLAALQSPPTRSSSPPPELVTEILDLFGYKPGDLDQRISPALIHGGADHFLLALNSRDALARMNYDLDTGRSLMIREGWITIMLVYSEDMKVFHSRNAFASGGVFEDPATGAATAAFCGYLKNIGWSHEGTIKLIQGEDMGMRSILYAEIPSQPGSSIRVSGEVRIME
ncbi:PhzF family phenazine biosynthesis protein [Rhodospirillaceae bacterium KN72]|uniref:PhzF family phenazine biosynthesis protein n=1 Tax=Pacificispira spongiicola TaxID=2729598 RepID=A0A7Y0E2G7_9PROT|nr:PhzF family phenazine biosynthesis protein [Pacificispira spongiicola]NMM45971.1 PhzF family phenazine biosynthesis protein [Pacificispira spongiicola]